MFDVFIINGFGIAQTTWMVMMDTWPNYRLSHSTIDYRCSPAGWTRSHCKPRNYRCSPAGKIASIMTSIGNTEWLAAFNVADEMEKLSKSLAGASKEAIEVASEKASRILAAESFMSVVSASQASTVADVQAGFASDAEVAPWLQAAEQKGAILSHPPPFEAPGRQASG